MRCLAFTVFVGTMESMGSGRRTKITNTEKSDNTEVAVTGNPTIDEMEVVLRSVAGDAGLEISHITTLGAKRYPGNRHWHLKQDLRATGCLDVTYGRSGRRCGSRCAGVSRPGYTKRGAVSGRRSNAACASCTPDRSISAHASSPTHESARAGGTGADAPGSGAVEAVTRRVLDGLSKECSDEFVDGRARRQLVDRCRIRVRFGRIRP